MVTAVDESDTVASVEDKTTVTVPKVADAIFIFPETTLVVTVPVTVVEAVMLIDETVRLIPETVIEFVTNTEAVPPNVTDPEVIVTSKLPSGLAKRA